ncbi:SRPBCC family protein [Rhodanobacter thiooxydans]|uniref:SRPBCC family protein n=1 Tax=Rhodanobacter thiooxydans TaxID=416169 RepID=UPI0009DA638D
MHAYTTSVDIEAPADLVWTLLSDVLSWPQRLPTVTSVAPLGNTTLAVGTRFHVIQPKVRPATWEVTCIEPGHSFTWRSRSSGLTMVANHVVDPTGRSRCRLWLDFAFCRCSWPLRYAFRRRSCAAVYRHRGADVQGTGRGCPWRQSGLTICHSRPSFRWAGCRRFRSGVGHQGTALGHSHRQPGRSRGPRVAPRASGLHSAHCPGG